VKRGKRLRLRRVGTLTRRRCDANGSARYDLAMCGRTILVSPGPLIRDIFKLDEVPDLQPRFNVAPFQLIPIIASRINSSSCRGDPTSLGAS
jgi:hypothetical protein